VCIWLFFKIDLCSAISFRRSRRELSIDVAEHRSILKNKGVTRIGYFSRKAYVQPYHSIGLGESFPLMRLNIGLSWKITEVRTNPVLLSHPNGCEIGWNTHTRENGCECETVFSGIAFPETVFFTVITRGLVKRLTNSSTRAGRPLSPLDLTSWTVEWTNNLRYPWHWNKPLD